MELTENEKLNWGAFRKLIPARPRIQEQKIYQMSGEGKSIKEIREELKAYGMGCGTDRVGEIRVKGRRLGKW